MTRAEATRLAAEIEQHPHWRRAEPRAVLRDDDSWDHVVIAWTRSLGTSRGFDDREDWTEWLRLNDERTRRMADAEVR